VRKKRAPAPKIESKRDTYFLAIHRGKSKRPHAIKIGQCRRGTLETRVRNLQTGSVDKIRILGCIHGASAERKFHRRFKGFHIRGEFYRPAPELLQMISTLAELSKLIEQLEQQGVSALVKNLERQQRLAVG
jgi:T5orf172 domain